MKTREEIAKDFELDSNETDLLDRLEAVQAAGARHGRAGWYPDGEFASDADWIYGTGDAIFRLEEILNDDFGSVFDLYQNAHAEHLPEGDVD